MDQKILYKQVARDVEIGLKTVVFSVVSLRYFINKNLETCNCYHCTLNHIYCFNNIPVVSSHSLLIALFKVGSMQSARQDNETSVSISAMFKCV